MDNKIESPVPSETCLSEVHEEEKKKTLEKMKDIDVVLQAYSETSERPKQVSPRESSESVYTDDDYLSIIAQQISVSRSRYVDKTRGTHKAKQLSSHDQWKTNKSFPKYAQDTTEANESQQTFPSSESDAAPVAANSYYARIDVEREFLEQSQKFCSACGIRVDTCVSYNYETCPWTTAFICCVLFPFLVIFAWLPFVLSHHFYKKIIICANCGTTLESN